MTTECDICGHETRKPNDQLCPRCRLSIRPTSIRIPQKPGAFVNAFDRLEEPVS